MSDQATQVLPGQGVAAPDAGREMIAGQPPAGVRQAGFVEPTAKPQPAAAEPRKRLSTTTISLPR